MHEKKVDFVGLCNMKVAIINVIYLKYWLPEMDSASSKSKRAAATDPEMDLPLLFFHCRGVAATRTKKRPVPMR